MTRTLIEKLEAADGPSRELDEAICLRLAYGDQWATLPHVTSSLDAAVALVERLDKSWCIERGGVNQYAAQVSSHGEYIGWHLAESSVPSLALCIALLKALEAREESE